MMMIIIIVIIIIYKKLFFYQTYKNGRPHKIWTKANCKKRGIKNYENMSREKLLGTFDEAEQNLKTLSENSKNAKSYTKCARSNYKNAIPIARWTRANRENERN